VAHRGTVFLDEIGDVDMQIQPKLLKVLEDKQFRRLGDVRDRRVDIRLIAPAPDLARPSRRCSEHSLPLSTILVAGAAPPGGYLVLANCLWKARPRPGRTSVTPAPRGRAAVLPLARQHPELRNVLERAFLLTDRQDREPATSSHPRGLIPT
jgi:hypothetical protein